MLIDNKIINFKAGNGGNGCISFINYRFLYKGGPDGGNGGNGGNIYLLSNNNINNLNLKDFYIGFNGEDGKSKNRKGKNGNDKIIKIPINTIIINYITNEKIYEFKKNNESLLIAKGGIGGKGNSSFVSSINRTPRIYTKGCVGDNKKILLKLNLYSDISVIGLPNSGKSTLISLITKNKNIKISNYNFTTKYPKIFKINKNFNKNITIMDTPALMYNSNNNFGLGIDFLKHVINSSLLLHIVDINIDIKNLLNNINIINNEIYNYDINFYNKIQWIIFNKVDLISNNKFNFICKYIEKNFNKNIKFYFLSNNCNFKYNINNIINDLFKFKYKNE